jgi:hypothetical protein
MSKETANPGASKLKGAFLWAGAQLAVEWFVFPGGSLWTAIAAALGGFAAGWVTVGLLNRLARWGVGGGPLVILGVLVGVAVASGAVNGLAALFNWFSTKSFDIDWKSLQDFLLSWKVAPAAGLGALTGLMVKGKAPSKKKK